MDQAAIEQAKGRLSRIEQAIDRLKNATDFIPAEEAWLDFLIAASTIYSKFEQGAKGFGRSQGWFGRKKKERKDDPLMRYIHHARNSDEHGTKRIVAEAGNQKDPFGKKMKFNERDSYHAQRLDDETRQPVGEKHLVYLDGPHLRMVRVHDTRYGDYCDPPTMHRGNEITTEQMTLHGVAELALSFLRELVAEAETYAEHPKP